MIDNGFVAAVEVPVGAGDMQHDHLVVVQQSHHHAAIDGHVVGVGAFIVGVETVLFQEGAAGQLGGLPLGKIVLAQLLEGVEEIFG